MSKTNAFVTITAVLILAIMAVGLQRGPVNAQAPATPDDNSDFDVAITLTGVTITGIDSLSGPVTLITLSDGTVVKVNPDTDLSGLTGDLASQGMLDIVVVPDDDGFVAKTITINLATATGTATGTPAVATATGTATGTPAAATATAPATGTAAANCGGTPVATKLANAFGVSESEIMAWHCQGFGFGEIAKAYKLAELCKQSDSTPLAGCKDAAGFFALKASGEGWGKIMKDSGVSPNQLAPGQIMKGKGQASPDASIVTKNKGKGNGKGNAKDNTDVKDKGKGNGKGNGKGDG